MNEYYAPERERKRKSKRASINYLKRMKQHTFVPYESIFLVFKRKAKLFVK